MAGGDAGELNGVGVEALDVRLELLADDVGDDLLEHLA